MKTSWAATTSPEAGSDELDALREAIRNALLNSGAFDEEMREQLRQMQSEGQLDELIDEVMERMEQEGYVTISPPHDPTRMSSTGGSVGQDQSHQRPVKFEVTDKGLDFLGYRALRDLLGSLGRSSFGRHDTRDTATGIETSGASKLYEFGDTHEPRHQRHAQFGDPARRTRPAAQSRIQRPARAPVRVSVLVRHGAHAGLLALDDSVRRGPLHAREESCHGALATDSQPVSRRHAFAGALPRLGRGAARLATGAGFASGRTTPTRARDCASRSAFCSASART